VLNYKTEPVAERIRAITGGAGVDRVIEMDIATNGPLDLDVLRTGGELVAYGSSPAPMNLAFPTLLAKNIHLKFFMVYHLTEADRLRAQSLLQRLLASGLLSHNIAARLPLSAVVEAHEAIESGTLVGKLVLQIQP